MVASGADDSAVIAASRAAIVRTSRLKADVGIHADGADANGARHSSEGEDRTSKWTARL
jgi:hypothetical protein